MRLLVILSRNKNEMLKKNFYKIYSFGAIIIGVSAKVLLLGKSFEHAVARRIHCTVHGRRSKDKLFSRILLFRY